VFQTAVQGIISPTSLKSPGSQIFEVDYILGFPAEYLSDAKWKTDQLRVPDKPIFLDLCGLLSFDYSAIILTNHSTSISEVNGDTSPQDPHT